MSMISSMYRFEFECTWRTPMLLLKPHFKIGNHCVFNELYTTPDLIGKRLGPISDIQGDYEAFIIAFTNQKGNERTLVFEKAGCTDPYGLIKVKGYSADCFLYKTIADNTLEVYISDGNGSQSSEILMMLMDAYLDKEIQLLSNKLQSNTPHM